jgi:hypothetical protein
MSLLIAGGAAALVLLVWYPPPLDRVAGGRELLRLMVAVDVILGPLITFTIWNTKKPRAELWRDVSTIGLVQVAALAYGVHTAEQARPAVVALEGNRLAVVRPIDIEPSQLERAPPELRTLSWRGPRLVATRAPTAGERLEAIDRAMQGQDLSKRPEFWLPARERPAAFAKAALPLETLLRSSPGQSDKLQGALAESGVPVKQTGYLPILARQSSWSALIDLKTGEIVGYVPIDGF